MDLKLTEAALTLVYQKWADQFGNGRDDNDQRFGQFIFNNFATGEDRMPRLFYEESAAGAYSDAMTIIQGQING
jgi:hypothetical protein